MRERWNKPSFGWWLLGVIALFVAVLMTGSAIFHSYQQKQKKEIVEQIPQATSTDDQKWRSGMIGGREFQRFVDYKYRVVCYQISSSVSCVKMDLSDDSVEDLTGARER